MGTIRAAVLVFAIHMDRIQVTMFKKIEHMLLILCCISMLTLVSSQEFMNINPENQKDF